LAQNDIGAASRTSSERTNGIDASAGTDWGLGDFRFAFLCMSLWRRCTAPRRLRSHAYISDPILMLRKPQLRRMQ